MATLRQSRGWIWFFLILAFLTVAWIAGFVIVRWRQQLTPEQLALARALWKEKGPRDYHLRYSTQGSARGTFVVEVRHGEVTSVTADGQPLESRLYADYSMSALLGHLQRFLDMKSEPGARRFLSAQFDAQDGHLKHYIYSDLSTRQKVEVSVEELRPMSPESQGIQ